MSAVASGGGEGSKRLWENMAAGTRNIRTNLEETAEIEQFKFCVLDLQ